jgi:hypothetical protein
MPRPRKQGVLAPNVNMKKTRNKPVPKSAPKLLSKQRSAVPAARALGRNALKRTARSSSLMSMPFAPVAYGSAQRTTFYRVSSAGDDIIVHCRDRLPIVELDTTVDAPEAINHAGKVLLEVPINPSSLGERLRRLSANYEFYRFENAIATYEGATGSSAIGSLLGFFDQDPVDGFDAGKRSLAEAASHPGAHSIKVWENGTWIMPPRVGGRYYIEGTGSTPADRRLQEQGTFRIMLDIPIGGTIPTETHNALGSVYMEYTVRLMKPALQANFVGTCDLMSWTGEQKLSATSNNIIENYNAADVPAVYDVRSNAGTVLEVNATSTGAAIAMSEGLWNVAATFKYSLPKATSGSVWEVTPGAAITFGGTPSTVNVNAFGTSNSASCVPAVQVYVVESTTTAQVDRYANLGFQMLVPSQATYYFTFAMTLRSGTDALTFSELKLSLSSAFATQAQVEILNPDSSDLVARLRTIESKLASVPEIKEHKRQDDGSSTITTGDDGWETPIATPSSLAQCVPRPVVRPTTLRVKT